MFDAGVVLPAQPRARKRARGGRVRTKSRDKAEAFSPTSFKRLFAIGGLGIDIITYRCLLAQEFHSFICRRQSAKRNTSKTPNNQLLAFHRHVTSRGACHGREPTLNVSPDCAAEEIKVRNLFRVLKSENKCPPGGLTLNGVSRARAH